jgi:uncharacterized protein involved in exopolysaccharide biosynthesis
MSITSNLESLELQYKTVMNQYESANASYITLLNSSDQSKPLARPIIIEQLKQQLNDLSNKINAELTNIESSANQQKQGALDKNQSLLQMDRMLTFQRDKIKKTINSYNDLESEYQDTQLRITQANYTFYLWIIVLIILIMIVMYKL